MKAAAILTLMTLATGVAVAQNDRPKIAIATFENPSVARTSTIGDGMTDILTTELQNTGKFTILERKQLSLLLGEGALGQPAGGNAPTIVEKARILGAKYMLMGQVTNFSYSETTERRRKTNMLGPDTIQTVFHQNADVRVDFRLIDVKTTETTLSEAGEAHKTNVSEVSELASWRRLLVSGSIASESTSSLIGRATVEALKDVVRKLNELVSTLPPEVKPEATGQVVAEEGGGLWIIGGLGSGTGLRKGDRLTVVHHTAITTPDGTPTGYFKDVTIGSMEVTDVSQKDHAEVRFLATPGGATPQVNDAVTVDKGAPEVAPAPRLDHFGDVPPKPPAGNPAVDAALKRAASLMTDRMWSQALDLYNQAGATSPADPRVLQGQALSHYMLGDFPEADTAAEKLLATGGAFTFPVAHFHAMTTCTGEFTLQHGKVSYSGGKDPFDVDGAGFLGVEVRQLSKGMMANEKLPDYPILEVRFRSAKGKEDKYQILPKLFSKQPSLSGKNFGSMFPMDDSDIREMQKFEQAMRTLMQKYVK